jgi:dienelactone hydrolase
METKNIFKNLMILIVFLPLTSFGSIGKSSSDLKEELVHYKFDSVTYDGYVVYDNSIMGKRPAVLVVHEWWGLNDYSKMRARELAQLGYIAMAVDMFGNGKIAVNPKEAQDYTAPYYKDPKLAKSRLDAAIKKIKEFKQTDPKNIAAIGYCFGGYIVLNAAKLGADLKGVVSFHGGMGGAPVVKNLLKAKVLVFQGENDKFVPVPVVNAFKRQLDSIGAMSTFRLFPNTTHAFTNPDATELGKKFNLPIEYNPVADKESWNDMKKFLAGLFGK